MSNALVDEIVIESGIKRAAAWERVRKLRTSRIDCDKLFSPLMQSGRRRAIEDFNVPVIAERLNMTRAAIRHRIKQYRAGEISREQVFAESHKGLTAAGESVARKFRRDLGGGTASGNAEWRGLSDKTREKVRP